jgi:alpha-L-rhamnosidase
VLLATGRDFCGYIWANKLQKVERFSGQRHFEEVYDLTVGDIFSEANRVELAPVADVPAYLGTAPHPCFDKVDIDEYASRGTFVDGGKDPEKLNRYSWTVERCQRLKDEWGFFDESEIERFPYRKMMRQVLTKTEDGAKLPVTLKAGEYALIDVNKIYAGFLRIDVKANEKSNVYLAYSELCTRDNFEFSNMNCQNVIEYELPKGFDREIMSFEPYTCRYAVVMVNEGEITLCGFGITKYEFDRRAMIHREFKDSELEAIYRAGARSFSHNAVDIYMDCPSRERAGWLCDSVFTSRAEYYLTGDTKIEDVFLENFRLFKKTSVMPEGMLPECYPGDIEDTFIPQWAMWYMLEVYEYLTERNKKIDKELFRQSLYGLVKFFAQYENADGLLQNLPSWNFVEWSKANEWVQDVNYPTNFLYAESLDRVGKLFSDSALCEKAQKTRATTIEKSFNGKVFIDNAVKDENGVPRNTENFSECGQYYAILFGGIDINDEKFAYIKKQVFEGFAEMKENSETFTYVDILPGFYLKMWTLMKLGYKEHLTKMIKDFFGEMIDLTGTLWEYKPTRRKGSYDHGFASYAVVAAHYCDM